MKFLSSWLISVFAVSILISLAEDMMPEGRVKVFGKFTCGLILMFAVLYPLINFGWPDLSFDGSSYTEKLEARRAELESGSAEELSALIESETETYICDEAGKLGLDCRASVNARLGSDGVPYPYSASMSIPENDALSEYISGELGIAAERQIWNAEVKDESG